MAPAMASARSGGEGKALPFPARVGTVQLDRFRPHDRGQRLTWLAQSACHGQGRRWPRAFGALGGGAEMFPHDLG